MALVEMDREALGILLFLAARAGREKRRLGVEDSEGSQGHDLPSRSSQADHPVLQLGFHFWPMAYRCWFPLLSVFPLLYLLQIWFEEPLPLIILLCSNGLSSLTEDLIGTVCIRIISGAY